MERLDKIIAREVNITRSSAKQLLRSGSVVVNGKTVLNGDTKCAPSDDIVVNGERITNRRFVYIMMNKPTGVVSASEGRGDTTVVDILPDNMKRRGLFPAGRLDKDTTGFVLITDDGAYAHDILSPSHHIDKTYIATLDKPFDDNVAADFASGMTLGDEKLLSAEISALNDEGTVAKVVLRQGLYHQVKRMFHKHGITVVALHRTAMGSLELDPDLGSGECRYLTDEEINRIKMR